MLRYCLRLRDWAVISGTTRKIIAGRVADSRIAVPICPDSTSVSMTSSRCRLSRNWVRRTRSFLVKPGSAGGADDAEHPLVVGLDRVVGDVAFDLDHGVIGAVADESDRPLGVDGADDRRHRIGGDGADHRHLPGVLGDARQDRRVEGAARLAQLGGVVALEARERGRAPPASSAPSADRRRFPGPASCLPGCRLADGRRRSRSA